MANKYLQRLTRLKTFKGSGDESKGLRRCLTTFDITLLGVGHMMGSGVYVLTCDLVRNTAGPATVLSYLIAGIASFLAALSYAEFGVRFPLAGSAYSYVYFSLGEFWAFFVGWNVILEHIIAIAAVTRSCSTYIDSLAKGKIHAAFISTFGVFSNDENFSQYYDFLAVAIIAGVVIYMSFGVRSTSSLNNLLCIVNIAILSGIIVLGFKFGKLENWQKEGGFFPYGINGVLKASSVCFYAYVGFDSIAASGEEAEKPEKSLPIATFVSMFIVGTLYMLTAAVLSLMVYYMEVDPTTGIPKALEAHGAAWAGIVVTVGALCGMLTVTIGTVFALTRAVFAMADDGLLFSILGAIDPTSKVPLTAMYAFTTFGAFFALIVNIHTLVDMMSIGTLTAYLVVSAGVVIYRYRDITQAQQLSAVDHSTKTDNSNKQKLKKSFQCIERRFGDYLGARCVTFCISLMVILAYVIGFTFHYGSLNEWYGILLIVVSVAIMVCATFLIAIHKQAPMDQKYKMPFVPYLPVAAVIIDAFLMTTLDLLTWARLVVWVFIGSFCYFGYGIRHSKLEPSLKITPIDMPIVATSISNKITPTDMPIVATSISNENNDKTS